MNGRSVLLWRPEMFHGRGLRPFTFDGWYFKMVDAAERHVWAVIPGVWMERDPSKNYCFVQFIDGVTGRTAMHRYPVEQFWSSHERFDIVCAHNRFSLTDMHLDMDEPDLHLSGDLHFSAPQGWPVRLWSPGAMGPFAFVPLLEGYHAVTSIDPRLTGNVLLDGEAIDFTGGKGYMERDWGSSFPRSWIWTQCNHFDTDGVCLTAAIAAVPLAGQTIQGFIVGFLYHGTFYRWTTWNGARIIHLLRDDHHAEFAVMHHNLLLEVWSGGRSNMSQVYAPRGGMMTRMLVEELTAVCQVRLTLHSPGSRRVLFEERGRHAGLEISGDLPVRSGEQVVEHIQGCPGQ